MPALTIGLRAMRRSGCKRSVRSTTKPISFVGDAHAFFAAPASEPSLARLYTQHPDATIVAGATDVGLWITKKLAPLEKIIHVGRVAELAKIVENPVGYAFGAIVSLARAAPVLGSIDPDIAEVLRRFGSIQVRACGTVGGNIANGSPIGDLAPMLIALDARVELRHGDHIRELPLENFFLDYGKQDRSRENSCAGCWCRSFRRRRIFAPTRSPSGSTRIFPRCSRPSA